MSEPTHSFIIPAYNESERLATSIPKVLEYVHSRGLQAEIIVVNDGSTRRHGRRGAAVRGRRSHGHCCWWRTRAIAARDTACAMACCTPGAR